MLPSKIARTSAVVGAVVWIAMLLVPIGDSRETELIQKVLLFGISVVVPLGLSLISPRPNDSPLLLRSAVIAQPFGAIAAFISFLLEPGPLSASLAGVWLIVTGLVALVGVARCFRDLRTVPELCINAGLVYLPVGGVWFVMSRFGFQPLEFGDTIVLLTAVHFHFAGFAAPAIVGMTGRTLAATSYPKPIYVLTVVGVVLSMPLVAAGITFSPRLALIGAAIISIALFLFAFLTLGWVLRLVELRSVRFLLVVSSLASSIAMVLACLYAYSIVQHTLILDIPTMAMSHGLLNAFGFTACALIAWTLHSLHSR
jgi:hypothetical protein